MSLVMKTRASAAFKPATGSKTACVRPVVSSRSSLQVVAFRDSELSAAALPALLQQQDHHINKMCVLPASTFSRPSSVLQAIWSVALSCCVQLLPCGL
jgi:hypothetical protein